MSFKACYCLTGWINPYLYVIRHSLFESQTYRLNIADHCFVLLAEIWNNKKVLINQNWNSIYLNIPHYYSLSSSWNLTSMWHYITNFHQDLYRSLFHYELWTRYVLRANSDRKTALIQSLHTNHKLQQTTF